MTENQPYIFILHGDDEVAMQQFVKKQISLLGDPSMAEMSISRLDGKTASASDLRNACLAASFFSSERLVILTNPLAKIESKRAGAEDEDGAETAAAGKQKSARATFLKFLSEIPETTRLVMWIEDQQKWRAGGMVWEVCGERNFLSKWVNENPSIAQMVGLSLPVEREMPGWIQKKALEMGGKFAPDACAELAGYVGNDTRLATLEIDKLITYTNGRRVEADDVMTISTSVMSSTIWNLTDALGEKDARKALLILHQLMDTLDIRQEIFPMIIWQFRQLLLAREVVEEGGNVGDLVRELHVAEFQGRKLFQQVQRFKLDQLRKAYRQVMAIEEEGKRGTTDLSVLLDQLIVQLASNA